MTANVYAWLMALVIAVSALSMALCQMIEHVSVRLLIGLFLGLSSAVVSVLNLVRIYREATK